MADNQGVADTLEFWISESFEYMGHINMSELHRVFNKMLHLRYSAVLWICFNFKIYELWIYYGSKYVRVTQGIK